MISSYKTKYRTTHFHICQPSGLENTEIWATKTLFAMLCTFYWDLLDMKSKVLEL